MKISEFRKAVLKESQADFAQRLGLKSKSRVCEIEKGNRCSTKIALEIEKISEGLISAADICPAVRMVREEAVRAA